VKSRRCDSRTPDWFDPALAWQDRDGHVIAGDDSRRDAIARLTDNEKDCLRRWMLPQTAKEIALDLGISPHAVEKRLKMARAKLGLSSSLQAARLLAANEEYQWLVPNKSDLANQTVLTDAATRDAEMGHRRTHHRVAVWIVAGGTTMILVAAAIIVGMGDAQPKATPEQAEVFLSSSFDTMDRDKSGFIDLNETPPIFVRDPQDSERRQVSGVQGQRMWIAGFDKNGDGKVSKAEFVGRMLPSIEAKGVPSNWRPRS
jgi:DNA-binding CsgD family transcriptional regulator